MSRLSFSAMDAVQACAKEGKCILSLRLSACLLTLLSALGCSSQTSPAAPQVRAASAGVAHPATLLAASSTDLDFGTVPQAGRHEVTFWLSNPGQTAVEVEEVRTSCDCFEITLEQRVIPPGGKVAARGKVDFTHDPRFTGSLRLDSQGTTQGQKTLAFAVYAIVEVKRFPRGVE